VSVKRAKSGSWYAATDGALVGQRGQPIWFADEHAARTAVDQLEHRCGGWEWIELQ
jgi:hypothetical protein